MTMLAVFAGCTSDQFTGSDADAHLANGEKPISFGYNLRAVTRAESTGDAAAAALTNQYIIYGEKDESDGSAPAAGHLVMQNYQVNYTANTAYTTASNTENWEYVGYQHTGAYLSHITPSLSGTQTIKYWDYSAANYVFTAVSAWPNDITSGDVAITKLTSGATRYDKGYAITVTDNASLGKIFLADRQEILKSAGTDRSASNAYGGNVTMHFRRLLAQVRAAVYETIPGYDISSIRFYVDNGSGEQTAAAEVSATPAFGAVCPNISPTGYAGTLTVTYNGSGTHLNQPRVSASGTAATNLLLGTNMNGISTSNLLATSASAPTFDQDLGAFTDVMPQTDDSHDMLLKVDYTLYNEVTHETIQVRGATAVVPSLYLQWQPNFKYTYLFKISDESNGQTGTGTNPAGLYPITFDALEVVSEEGQAEYITTVPDPTDPSITTFGVAPDDTYNAGLNQYTAGSDIYVTVMDGGSVAALTLGTNINVYEATTTDAVDFPINEESVAASVAAHLADPSADTQVNTSLLNTDATIHFTALPQVVTSVPAEDGTAKTVTAALKLTGVKATTPTTALVIEYIKAPDKKAYKVINVITN